MVRALSLHSIDETRALAETLAPLLRCGDVVTVAGDLGAGKTSFAQALIQAMSLSPVEVTSPTFTLLQTYPVTLEGGAQAEFYHYDLYRIEHPSALVELGLEEALSGVTLIEWPERLAGYPLPVSLAVSLTLRNDGSRAVTLDSNHPRYGQFTHA